MSETAILVNSNVWEYNRILASNQATERQKCLKLFELWSGLSKLQILADRLIESDMLKLNPYFLWYKFTPELLNFLLIIVL